jgi:hypothetical protein
MCVVSLSSRVHELVFVRTSYLDTSYPPSHTCSYPHILLSSYPPSYKCLRLCCMSQVCMCMPFEVRRARATHEHTHTQSCLDGCFWRLPLLLVSVHNTHTHTHTVRGGSVHSIARQVRQSRPRFDGKTIFQKSQNSRVCYLDAQSSAHLLPHHLTL